MMYDGWTFSSPSAKLIIWASHSTNPSENEMVSYYVFVDINFPNDRCNKSFKHMIIYSDWFARCQTITCMLNIPNQKTEWETKKSTRKDKEKVVPAERRLISRVCGDAKSWMSLQRSNWVEAFVLSRPELLLPAGCCPSVVTTLADCAQSDTSTLSPRICLSNGFSRTWQRDLHLSWEYVHPSLTRVTVTGCDLGGCPIQPCLIADGLC